MIFNLIYILGFAIWYIISKNYEFLGYVAVVTLIGVLIMATLKKTKFDYLILWGLSIWGFFHMAGGTIVVNGAVLYKYIFINLFQIAGDAGELITVLRFDHVIHFYGFGVTALVFYHLLKQKLRTGPTFVVYLSAMLASMGAGALNEIVEFLIAINVASGVGGYINNSLDLIFNSLGALAAVIYVKVSGR
ncbi:MAG: DUF2238 domain-containing protein [Nanoarchaeota archaeon]